MLDHMAILLLVFLRSLHTVFQVTVPVYIPNKSVVGFDSPFFIPSPAFVICRLFNDDHSDWCEVVPHFFFFFFATLTACGSSQGRALTPSLAVTQATSVELPDP